MGEAVQALTGLMAEANAYDLAIGDIAERQVAALDERLQEMIGRIKLVRARADEAGIDQVRTLADIVPLLLPHTAYKSYPEGFLTAGRWDRLTKWLGTISSQPTDNIDVSSVENLDSWIAACGEAGHLVSSSSGTTGKPAMLPAIRSDLEFSARAQVAAVQWGSAIRVGDNRTPAGPASVIAHTPRNIAAGRAMASAFMDPEAQRFESGLPPATVGSLTMMVTVRRKIAEGTAQPSEIAAFEAESAAREKGLAAAQIGAVDHVIANRDKRLYLTGMWAALYSFAEAVRARGLTGADFHPENAIYLGGGLKRAQLPENYREFVFETFNLQPENIYQTYSMQELGSPMPRCSAGRYHIPPWLVCLPLDKSGEALVTDRHGEFEARAAFFDLSLEGRWGGVISGDRIHVTFEPCACGHTSPSIRDDVDRFADIQGDDKIACSGTVDAYVRGMA